MIVDIHTHCLQPEHLSRRGREADEKAGYPPWAPLAPETYLEGIAPVDWRAPMVCTTSMLVE
jgi:hypothetical protein